METIPDLVTLFDSGVTVVFAVVVWKELHQLRTGLIPHLQTVAERLTALEMQHQDVETCLNHLVARD
jgi:hypothetical protein